MYYCEPLEAAIDPVEGEIVPETDIEPEIEVEPEVEAGPEADAAELVAEVTDLPSG